MRRALVASVALALACSRPGPNAASAPGPAAPGASTSARARAVAGAVTTDAGVTGTVARAPAAPSATGAPAQGGGLEALRALGPLHGAPVRIAADGPRPAGWLAFVGGADVATAAWLVAEGPGRRAPLAVDAWPAGVQVLGGVAREGLVYVLVETRAVLDQPGGVRAVVQVPAAFDRSASLTAQVPDAWPALVRVADVADLERRVAALPARFAAGATAQGRCASVQTAALGAVLSAQGVDYAVLHQGSVVRVAQHYDGHAVLGSPHSARLLAAVRSAAQDECCDGACGDLAGLGDGPAAAVGFAQEGGRPVIRALLEHAPAVAPVRPVPTAARAVAASGVASAAIAQGLQARFGRAARVLVEGPLGAAGTIAVARVETDGQPPVVVVLEEAGVVRFLAVAAAVPWGEATPVAARLLDANGDGRTDVLLTAQPSRQGDAQYTAVYLTPPATLEATAMADDLGSALALVGATDPDAAVQTALGVPWRSVGAQDACRLLTAGRTLAGMQRVATTDARVVAFEEPALPTYRAAVTRLSAVSTPEEFQIGAYPCSALACAADRPVCTAREAAGPGSDVYWFTWDHAALRIAGYATYSGS